MKKKSFKLPAMVGLVGVLLFSGCGGAAKDATMEAVVDRGFDYGYSAEAESSSGSYNGIGGVSATSKSELMDSADYGSYEEPKESAPVLDGNAKDTVFNTDTEKLIRTIRMRLQTKEFDTLMVYLEDRVAEVGGYVQSSQIYGNDMDKQGYRSAELTYRIPQKQLDYFVAGVDENATVVYKTENAENVTLQYADTESRLKALQIEQERFLALLENATDMKSIIAIEQHLTELRYEIESHASQLRLYDNRVNYSTVTISVSEVNRIVPVEKDPTLFSRMKAGFDETVQDLKEGGENFLVWFVTNFIYLIIWAVIIIVGVVIIKKILKKKCMSGRKNKATTQEQEPSQTEEEENDRMDLKE